jgi:zinc protease
MSALAPAAGAAVVHEHVLDNGLRVLLQEAHAAPLVSVWCWYKVGSRDEDPGLTGVSHWVEHMNFKGSTNIPRDQVKGIIERYGGSWNGYTWIDQTTYTETATKDALDQMLFIEAERMGACLYEPEDVASERTVIISELQGGENEPEQLLDQEVTAMAFRVHGYRHPTIGWLSDLQSMTRTDLYGHYRRFYVPNNATLVLAGDFETSEALRRVTARFGHLAPAEVRRRIEPTEPEPYGERRVVVARPGTAAYLRIAFRAPAVADPEFPAMLVLDSVLTGAKGVNIWSGFRTPAPQRKARLYTALVDAGLASAVSGTLAPTAHPFLYTVSVTATEGTRLAALEEAVTTTIERMRRDGITTAELDRARRQLLARLVFEDDSVSSIAHQLGFFETIGSWRGVHELPGRIQAVTLDAVNAVAASRLTTSRRVVGWFDPQPA